MFSFGYCKSNIMTREMVRLLFGEGNDIEDDESDSDGSEITNEDEDFNVEGELVDFDVEFAKIVKRSYSNVNYDCMLNPTEINEDVILNKYDGEDVHTVTATATANIAANSGPCAHLHFEGYASRLLYSYELIAGPTGSVRHNLLDKNMLDYSTVSYLMVRLVCFSRSKVIPMLRAAVNFKVISPSLGRVKSVHPVLELMVKIIEQSANQCNVFGMGGIMNAEVQGNLLGNFMLAAVVLAEGIPPRAVKLYDAGKFGWGITYGVAFGKFQGQGALPTGVYKVQGVSGALGGHVYVTFGTKEQVEHVVKCTKLNWVVGSF